MPKRLAENELSKPLEFTGERFTPECVREIWYEHYHRYAFARGMVSGLRVLDAACGEGYGSALLAGAASGVTGVDVSAEAVQHARERYASKNLDFRAADCLDLPFAADEFDCIVSFETLEHLEDHDGLLNEFRRVLKPAGFLLLSSPDKAVYSGSAVAGAFSRLSPLGPETPVPIRNLVARGKTGRFLLPGGQGRPGRPRAARPRPRLFHCDLCRGRRISAACASWAQPFRRR